MTELTPRNPELYPRRALVCVIGLAPQVLTETLYALAQTIEPRWVPTEIHAITTSAGAERLKALAPETGSGPFEQLCSDYLADEVVALTAPWVHVIARDGEQLKDIEVQADSTAAADTILRVISDLAIDPGCAIHASIAGGRKTMGFYLGYAMSLLGRPQDRLSHVLVAPSEFENHSNFYYPTKLPSVLTMRDGSQRSTDEARVTLAPIPVVLFANGLRDKVAVAGKGYESLVRQAQTDLVPEPLMLFPATRRVVVGELTAELDPAEMALYTFLALLRRDRMQPEGFSESGLVHVNKDALRNRGFEKRLLESAHARVGLPPPGTSVELDDFKPRVSSINKALKLNFGVATARRLSIMGPRERGIKDGQYGLVNLDPSFIHIN